jgi:hypothetical protein
MAKQKEEVPRSALILAEMIKNSPDLLNPTKQDAKQIIDKMAESVKEHFPTPVLVSKAGIYYLVVIFLGAVSTFAVIGAIILSAMTLDSTTFKIPDIITALGSAAIGALAGLLAPSPATK